MVTSNAVTLIVEVTDRHDKNMSGTVFNRYLQKRIAFANDTQMLIGLEQMLNTLRFPQESISTKNTFNTHRNSKNSARKDMVMQNAASSECTNASIAKSRFIIDVQYRQNATWQGTIQWVEGNKKQHFRSALEMLKLMDTALEAQETQGENKNPNQQ